MLKYSVSEKNVRYKVLLYSDNFELTDALHKKLAGENIDLVVKSTAFADTLNSGSGSKFKNYLKIIYDLTYKEVDYRKIISEAGRLTNDVVLLFKYTGKKDPEIKISKNKAVFVSGLSKRKINQVVQYLRLNLMNNGAEVINLSDTQNTGRNFKKRFMFAAGVIVFLITPFLLNLYLLLSSTVYNTGLLEHTDLKTEKAVNKADEFITKHVFKLDKFYTSIILIGPVYESASKGSEEAYIKALARSQVISKTLDYNESLNKLTNQSLFEKTKPSNTAVSVFNGLSLADRNSLKGYYQMAGSLEKVRNLYEKLLSFSKGDDIRYFAVIVQGKNKMTVTGGDPEKIFIDSITNGKITSVDKVSAEELLGQFKANVNDLHLLQNDGNFKFFENAIDTQNKFKAFKIMIQETYHLKISGVILLEEDSIEKINAIKNLALKKNLSLSDSSSFYENLINLTGSSDVNIYFSGDSGLVYDNNYFEVTGQNLVSKCFDNKVTFTEATDDFKKFKSGEVTLNGICGNGVLSLKLYYSNSSSNSSYSLIVKTPRNWKANLSEGKNEEQEKVYSADDNLLITKITGKPVKQSIADYEIPLAGCENGFGFTIVKPPGNSGITLGYQLNTYNPYFLYLDKTLTGRGNKFYNSRLLYLMDNISFEFVK